MIRTFVYGAMQSLYRALRPALYLSDPERIHERMTAFGGFLSTLSPAKRILGALFHAKHPALEQRIHGIRFENPVGLAAGYDYYAQLPALIGSLGFGFESVGTVTHDAYEGNPPPRLGRLIQSKSLMANKGFKNAGIHATLDKLAVTADAAIGLSIGSTNSHTIQTLDAAIADIVAAFEATETAAPPMQYYELNISCPNLLNGVDFFPTHNLSKLLEAVTSLKLSKPMFIKMPIEKTDEETLEMFRVIAKFPVHGVIIGNLQKNRHDPALRQDEVQKYNVGNFSGMATQKRSNELIRLAYKHFGNRFTIIGCGGIFSAEDAYEKITLGASLVQLITGLIFVGPQLPAQINSGLVRLLAKDGHKHISEAVGKLA